MWKVLVVALTNAAKWLGQCLNKVQGEQVSSSIAFFSLCCNFFAHPSTGRNTHTCTNRTYRHAHIHIVSPYGTWTDDPLVSKPSPYRLSYCRPHYCHFYSYKWLKWLKNLWSDVWELFQLLKSGMPEKKISRLFRQSMHIHGVSTEKQKQTNWQNCTMHSCYYTVLG